MESIIFWVLLFAALPFVLPIVSLISQSRLKRRLRAIEDALHGQERTIDELKRQLREQTQPPAAPAVKSTPAPPVAKPVPPAPPPPVLAPRPVAPPPVPALPPVATTRVQPPPRPEAPPTPPAPP